MLSQKHRRVITPAKPRNNSNQVVQDHVVKNVKANNVLVSEYDVLHKQKPTPFWMRDLNIPRWLLLLLASLAVIVFTGFAIFASVVTLKKETNGGACKAATDCRQDLGLMCNNYRCGCAYSHFWSESYNICERRRMINRTCYNDSECDNLGNLQCINVTLTNGNTQSQCQCKSGSFWNGATLSCGTQSLFNGGCLVDSDCDTTRFLLCNTGTSACICNSSMFWNGNANSGTCEYKRTVGQYCYPYDDNWCDDFGPVGQGLTCSHYVNPYGSEYGVCQCDMHQFYNGSATLGNGFCVSQKIYNQSCGSTSECDYRVNLTCLSNLCLCPSGYNYDPTVVIGTVNGSCLPAAGYLQNCSNSILCSSSQNLYCEFSYYGGSNLTGACLCNTSWSFWDGITCASKLSIGGQCTNNTHCITSAGLFCSNYTQSIGQCDCDLNHFWNYTCVLKQWYNTSCSSSYICDDNRGLQCAGTGTTMFQKCDCYNVTYIWDSLYVTNRSYTCIPKLGYTQGTCFGDLECEDFNYLKCDNVTHTCQCSFRDYYDGTRCQRKLNYTDPCAATFQCSDFSPVNLICRLPATGPAILECLCNSTSYWEACTQQCTVSKQRHQACTLTGNCSSNECDLSANLQCINDSYTNITGSGWCNCTSLQWWNGSYCRDKGIPSWGANTSAICNATYQCADYNLVSCPLGGNWPAINSTCECATTKYWNGITCLDRVVFGQPCTLWLHYPVNTSTCLTSAGAGLICSSSSCVSGTNCTGGTCYCPTGTHWNASFLICATTTSTG